MTQLVTDQSGRSHEFPDEATPQMIAKALNVKYKEPEPEQSQVPDIGRNRESPVLQGDMGKTSAMDVARNLAQGVVTGGENIQESLSQVIPGVPKPAMRGQPLQGDLAPRKGAESPFLQTVGEYAGAGTRLPAMAVYGALDNPEHPIWGSVLSSAGLGAFKLGKGVLNKIKSTVDKHGWEVFNKVDWEHAANIIKRGKDKLQQSAENLYNHIQNEAPYTNFSNLPVDKQTQGTFNEILSLVKDKPATKGKLKNLIDKASSGEYQPFHELQSDLGTIGSSLLNEDTFEARAVGRKLLDLRNDIKHHVKDRFYQVGRQDLGNLWTKASDTYKEIFDVYHPKKGYGSTKIRNLVNPPHEMPDKKFLKKFLNTKSDSVQKILDAHPELIEILNRSDVQEKMGATSKLIGKGIVNAAGLGNLAAVGKALV